VVIGDESVTDFPTLWTDRAFGNFAGSFIPNTVVLFAILAVAFGVLLHATPFGGSIYAIGSNEEASYFTGLRVKRIKLTLFVLSGTVAALAGIVISLRNSTAAANVGQGFELTAITAVLLGGVSIFGGRGTIAGVILALFLLGAIQKALLLSESISSYWIQIVTGALLVGSVLGPNLARRVTDARRRRSSQRPEEGQ
jgi:rhamnose transport system permease protein